MAAKAERSWPIHHSNLYNASVAAQPLRILLAEDDPEMRRLIALSLSKEGHEILEAANGGELLALVTSRVLLPAGDPIDLVISDLRMPGCSGLEVLARLRRADHRLPFILITAFGDDETHAEARRLGAVLFDKPFELHDLKTVVVNLAGAR